MEKKLLCFMLGVLILKLIFFSDFDTDEETDVLLQKPYQKDSKVDIPELTQPPVNRSAQVSFCPCDLILF